MIVECVPIIIREMNNEWSVYLKPVSLALRKVSIGRSDFTIVKFV